MKAWTSVLLLASVVATSLSAPSLDLPTTTDRAVEEVRQAESRDLDFIRNDLKDLQQSYVDFIKASNSAMIVKLSQAINHTYEEDMPKNSKEHDQQCLQGIFDDVEDMTQDLNVAVSVCANLSHSMTRVDNNVQQFKVLISNLKVFSENLENIIDACIEKFPKISWDRLQCVFDQLEVLNNQFNPVFEQFNMFNMAFNGHLMLLVVESSMCFQEALLRLSEINKTILTDIDNCKI